MPRRNVLTDRQRSALFDLPADEAALLRHYTLADDDIDHIRARRQPQNRLGFALQLCAFRYPGRLLNAGEVIPFLDYPPEVRRLIYTTNAIEALNSKIRRAVRTRGHFPSDDAAAKLIYLALNATSTEWKRSVREWHAVKSQFAIMFEDRFPMT